MAGLRPFRGLRYTQSAGELDALVAPPSAVLTPAQRESFANRSAYNSVALAAPEGHGDDRSKFIRYARAAARLAEWRREGFLALEDRPAFYRLSQRFGPDKTLRTSLFAIVPPDDLAPVEVADPKVREDRLRLLEATQTVLEPATVFYDDPDGRLLDLIRNAPATAEALSSLDGLTGVVEPIEDPAAIEAIQAAFAEVTLLAADGVESIEAAKLFPGSKGALVALASHQDAYIRLSVHRVLRRLPGGLDATLVRLAESFAVEEHHNRNLILYVDRAQDEGRVAFGMATEGGRGFLLTPRHPLDVPAPVWLYREIFGPLLNYGENDPSLAFTDPIQAVRAADEGAAAAFILPRPSPTVLIDVYRDGMLLPSSSARTYPALPTGLVFWPMGDDI